MGIRRPLIAVSILFLVAGLGSAVVREISPGGTGAFNLGVDFQGGTVITAKFKGNHPSAEEIRNSLSAGGINESVIQTSTDKTDEVLIKIPLFDQPSDAPASDNPRDASADPQTNSTASNSESNTAGSNQAESSEKTGGEGERASRAQIDTGRQMVVQALNTFGKEAEAGKNLDEDPEATYKIVGTDYVGPVAGEQLRDQAIIATLIGMLGILLFIAFRYDWTYAAGAVIAVLHDVLITLAFFTMFQWEVSLTVLAAFLTLVGFSVNDSIVIFDRIRENMTLRRNQPIYELTNDSINQTMSRTIVTNGLFFLTVLALVLFGGEVLRGFSLALFVGAITGTYSTIAIASPIAIWWQDKLGAVQMKHTEAQQQEKLASASRRSVKRRPIARS